MTREAPGVELAETVRDRLRAVDVRRIAEGHQSRVYEVLLADGSRLAAKVLDAGLVDAEVVATRVGAVAELAAIDRRVCRPVPIGGSPVTEILDESGRPALLLCSVFADGVAFDPADEADAELMGATLAGLHRSLARVDPVGIPVVAALASDPGVGIEVQLLHGDFNAGNLRRDASFVQVFDFEDCGVGPIAYDVANALYMVLFDATLADELHRYRAFETAFLAGYAGAADTALDRAVIRGHVDRRVDTLAGWLADPSSAPVGIRTATAEWHCTLRSFVERYRRGGS